MVKKNDPPWIAYSFCKSSDDKLQNDAENRRCDGDDALGFHTL